MTEAHAPTDRVAPLVEHFFRHESGRLVSVLARVFSLRNLDLVEDVVQAALLEALRVWRVHGVPDNPAGWVRRVARNKILDALRHRKTVEKHLLANAPEDVLPAYDDLLIDSEIEDSQLRMIFACCHPTLAIEDQVALTLKTLCGFGNAEIARGLLTGEEAVKKRLQRAKQSLIDGDVSLDVPAAGELEGRLTVVHRVLYLLFNEGYYATSGERAVREDLCEEAVRLCGLLAEHARYGTPATHALLALMLFHAARLDARLDEAGRILLLDEQDRTKWNQDLIRIGRRFLDQSAKGQRITTYHIEAGIAMQHCEAESFATTDWAFILKLYDALLRYDPSPIYLLNRAITLAHLQGPRAGIESIREMGLEEKLADYHLLDATLGELHRRLGEMDGARKWFDSALAKTRSEADRELLRRKREGCR